MARVVLASPTVVAQRLTELMQCFPTAASSGVQWETLIRKYNERYSTTLDIASLGHSSALAAASALLWDVLRIVDSEDTDNPVIAVEDFVALNAEPGAMATWPSLYKSLCEIAQEHGSVEQEDEAAGDIAYTVLVSQLKPLLQRHWHAQFDETSLSYLTEEGTPVRLKKMKHLLHAVLRFREHLHGVGGPVNAALVERLELVQSKKHNDLLLRCVVAAPQRSPPADKEQPWLEERVERWCDAEDDDESTAAGSFASSAGAELQKEIEQLRCENERLRSQNCFLEKQACPPLKFLEKQQVESPTKLQLWALDDPFEPPPTQYWSSAPSPMSTAAPSEFCISSGSSTPYSRGSSRSGAETPVLASFGSAQVPPQACFMMPVTWFSMGDLSQIPSGVVQQAKAVFEQHAVIPSFFVQQ